MTGRSVEAKKRRAAKRSKAIEDQKIAAKKRPAFSTDAALCRADCCDEPATTAGWCEQHYHCAWRGAPMAPRRPHRIPPVRLLPRITG